jgi:hypothetical protein
VHHRSQSVLTSFPRAKNVRYFEGPKRQSGEGFSCWTIQPQAKQKNFFLAEKKLKEFNFTISFKHQEEQISIPGNFSSNSRKFFFRIKESLPRSPKPLHFHTVPGWNAKRRARSRQQVAPPEWARAHWKCRSFEFPAAE